MKTVLVFAFTLLLMLSGQAQHAGAQDFMEGYSDHFTAEDGQWNTVEETLQDAQEKVLLSTVPGGAIAHSVLEKMNQGEDDPGSKNRDFIILGFVIAIMIAAWLLVYDFIELLQRLKEKAVKAVVGKVVIIVVTFLSIWVPGWNVFFMVARAAFKVIKIIRATRRVVRTVNAASNAVIKH